MTTQEAVAQDWHRLDPRLIPLNLTGLVPPLAGVAATALLRGAIPPEAYWTFASIGAVFVVLVAAGLVRYATTRYRITAERVERRSGLLVRSHLSIPRDRVRSVDLTANPLHRVFGLTVVKVGTGQTGGSLDTTELALNAVTRQRADELRTELLDRGTTTPQPETQDADTAAAEPAPTAAGAEEQPIATLQWSWIRYAPLTGWTLFVAFILLGGAYRILDGVGLDPFETGLAQSIYHRLIEYTLLAVIVVGLVAILLVGMVGATLIYLESWWGYRLTRDGGVFRVRRGLLTTRSVSLEERRLRGVVIVEPITMRWARGAQTKAVATGLAQKHDDRQKNKDALLPPAPLPVAHRVSADVLAEDETPVAARGLTRHPRAALRRRLVRAVLPPVLLAAVLAVASRLIGWLPGWPAVVALCLVVVTVPLAFDAYRNLGHTLTGRYLVTRYGTVLRQTVGLRRSGVIGWTVSRSFFQRRAGLATIAATTGAGGGAYEIRDAAESEGLLFAERAVPDLLTPFLDRSNG